MQNSATPRIVRRDEWEQACAELLATRDGGGATAGQWLSGHVLMSRSSQVPVAALKTGKLTPDPWQPSRNQQAIVIFLVTLAANLDP